jgi:glutaredoxin
MNKAKKVVTVFMVISIVFIAGLYYYSLQVERSSGMTFYYGITCPHCKIVEEYMNEVNATSVLDIEMKEVYENSVNAAELQKVAKKCGINGDSIGVPLLYFNGECYVGDVDAKEIIRVEMEKAK